MALDKHIDSTFSAQWRQQFAEGELACRTTQQELFMESPTSGSPPQQPEAATTGGALEANYLTLDLFGGTNPAYQIAFRQTKARGTANDNTPRAANDNRPIKFASSLDPERFIHAFTKLGIARGINITRVDRAGVGGGIYTTLICTGSEQEGHGVSFGLQNNGVVLPDAQHEIFARVAELTKRRNPTAWIVQQVLTTILDS